MIQKTVPGSTLQPAMSWTKNPELIAQLTGIPVATIKKHIAKK